MPFLIFFLFISMPVLEVASIVEVSRWIGAVPTFLLLAAGVAFGMYLIRSQSLAVGRKMMDAMRTGVPPEASLLESGTISLAGVLFMVPGFITDVIAILILMPWARRGLWRALFHGYRAPRDGGSRTPVGAEPQKPKRTEDVIDVDYTEVPPGSPPASGTARHSGSPWQN